MKGGSLSSPINFLLLAWDSVLSSIVLGFVFAGMSALVDSVEKLQMAGAAKFCRMSRQSKI
jgi:hypothetical protein